MAKKVLFVMPRLPFPATSGRKTSLYHYCRILSDELGYQLVVAAFLEEGDDANQKPGFIDKLVVLPKPKAFEKIKNIILNSLIRKKYPLQVSLYLSKNAKAIVNNLIMEEKPDVVIGDMVRSTEYIRDAKAFTVADLDDRISLRYKRQLESDIDGINPYGAFLNSVPNFLRRIMLKRKVKLKVVKNEIALLQKYELEIGRTCDSTVFVAEQEVQTFNLEVGEQKAVAVPIGVDTSFFSFRECGREGYDIGFLGALSVAHNENAVRHFIVDIFPHILNSVPKARFIVVGGGASADLRAFASDSIVFTGRVEDVREHLEKCKVFVCPMLFGSGIKTKNLEAMSMGLPIVTTSIGAENIDAENGREWIIEDNDIGFANKVIMMLNSDEYRKTIADNGSRYVKEKWTWDWTKEILKNLIG